MRWSYASAGSDNRVYRISYCASRLHPARVGSITVGIAGKSKKKFATKSRKSEALNSKSETSTNWGNQKFQKTTDSSVASMLRNVLELHTVELDVRLGEA